uniref:Uncharacterized protein n=1 Tax=Rhizophora mucronata TaxID=61149 RepID=A0A2P2J047_RHIMU
MVVVDEVGSSRWEELLDHDNLVAGFG